jgi:outer membrane protein, multidrug efflux system
MNGHGPCRRPVAWSLGMLAISLGGCSLTPSYQSPAAAVPAGWPAGDAYLKSSEATLPRVNYREVFADPALQRLIERALANNQDVRIALANVASVRGQLRVQRAQLLPRLDATASASTGESGSVTSSGNVASTGGRRTSYDLNVGLSAFEVDLFGRLSSLSDAALQTYLASEAAVRAARLSLVAEVATAYLTLASDRSLLAIAHETETTAARSVELTRARLSGGVAPRSDLRQAETVLAQARADLASLTTVVAQDRNALELLLGAPVLDAELPQSIESVDSLLVELPAGLESDILLRRPDVVQSEYQLRAANARIGAARAAFFPSIGLTAVAGLASSALSSLFTSGAFAWSVGPSVSLPLFDAGANRGNLDDIAARRDAAVGQYQKTIQVAFREVADALARRGTIASQVEAQTQLEAAARDSAALADARYREGVDPFLSSLDAQRTLYSARRALASARLLRAGNLVELYRALGGDTG